MTIVARTPTVAFLYFALMIFHVHECTLEARVTTNRWDVPPQGVEYQACSVRVFTSAALIDYIPQHQCTVCGCRLHTIPARTSNYIITYHLLFYGRSARCVQSITCTMATLIFGLACLVSQHQTKHSISAIANLPVKQFMGAAREGWGPYFRNLHSKMRKEGTTPSTARRMNRPPPDRRRRPRQAPPPPRRALSGATISSQATASGRHRDSRQVTHGTSTNNRSSDSRSSSTGCLTRRQRRQRVDDDNFDGLAESRARAARREAEERVTERLAMRLQALWQELKIPSPDQAYITATYLEVGGKGGSRGGGEGNGDKGQVAHVRGGTGNPASGDVHRELARQIRLLLEHRTATIKVRAYRALQVSFCAATCDINNGQLGRSYRYRR